jgi:hypothetical protein
MSAPRQINGVLIRTLEVYCAGCEEFWGGLSGNSTDAGRELRQGGWAIRGGYWHCPDCKDDPAQAGSRLYK